VLENQPNRKRAHFRRKSVRCLACHRSTFSRLGASGKPGAGHCAGYCSSELTLGFKVSLAPRATMMTGSALPACVCEQKNFTGNIGRKQRAKDVAIS
jgi:hypothetical protein